MLERNIPLAANTHTTYKTAPQSLYAIAVLFVLALFSFRHRDRCKSENSLDQGNLTGIDNVDETYTRLTNGIRDAIHPNVTMFVRYVLQENKVIRIEVGEGSCKLHLFKSIRWIAAYPEISCIHVLVLCIITK